MVFLNQYSYVLFTVILGVGLSVALWRWQRPPVLLRIGLLAVFIVAAVGVNMARRYPAPEVSTLAEAEAILENETPTFVMLYSNYCVACMASLPAVRELSTRLAANEIDTLLINIHDAVGAALADRFEFVFSPTYIVFGPNGTEVLRANSLPRLEDIRLALAFEQG